MSQQTEAIRRALLLREKGQLEEAKEILRSLLDERPDDLSILRELAVISELDGDSEEHRGLRMRMLELCPKDPAAIHMAIVANLPCEDRACVELIDRLARHGLTVDPNDVNLLQDLALLYLYPEASVTPEEALRLFQQALRRDPDNWHLLINFATFLDRGLGRSLEAISLAKQALARMPESHELPRSAVRNFIARLEQQIR